MSDYYESYSFRVDSKEWLVSLKIVPSLGAPALCAQVHKMDDDTYWMYWNVGLRNNEYFSKSMGFFYENKSRLMKNSSNVIDILNLVESDDCFQRYIKKYVPVQKNKLNDDNIKKVYDLINSDWGEPYINPRSGLDGHRYYIKIFGIKFREYETWCRIPDEWYQLIPFVNLILDITKIEDREFYAPFGCIKNECVDYEPLEIPEWMLSPKK